MLDKDYEGLEDVKADELKPALRVNTLKISVKKETSDGINTTIIGKQTDGTPITIKTSMIAPNITDVSVRSGVIGIWNKKVSELIHASIANKLQ